jgi:hypothetical protein
MIQGKKIPCITIHGVGNHFEGDIEKLVSKSLKNTNLNNELEVSEFNWNKFIEHSRYTGIKDSFWFIQKTAHNIKVSSELLLANSHYTYDKWLGEIQLLTVKAVRTIVSLTVSLLIASLFIPLFLIALSLYAAIEDYYPVSAIGWIYSIIYPIIYVVFCGLVLILLIGALRYTLRTSNKVFLYSVRICLLLILQPFLIALSGVFGRRFTVPIFIIFFLLSLLAIIIEAGYFPVIANNYNFPNTLNISIYFGLLLSSILAISYSSLSRKWFVGPVKVLLDIFRYLAESTYRSKILIALGDEINNELSNSNSKDFVILAHSLGTVIALDMLINGGCEWSDKNVTLITMGSPLKRFFIRFFPGILFPSDINEIASLSAQKLSSFKWINIYRPFDYIGTSLGFSSLCQAKDVSTGQWWKILSSHSNYWYEKNGNHVSRKIIKELKSIKPIGKSTKVSLGLKSYIIPINYINKPKHEKLYQLIINSFKYTKFLVPIIITFWVGNSFLDRKNSQLNTIKQIENVGIEVESKISVSSSFIFGGSQGGSERYDCMMIEFTALNNTQYKLYFSDTTVYVSFRVANYLFEFDDVFSKIKSRCIIGTRFFGWLPKYKKICTGKLIVKYSPKNPEQIIIPGFNREFSWVDWGGRWYYILIVIFIFSGICLVPFKTAWISFFLLMGLPVSESRMNNIFEKLHN